MKNKMCEQCGKREATVYYRSECNGQVEEKQLCADCAQQLGISFRLNSERLFESLWEAFSPMPLLVGGSLSRPTLRPNDRSVQGEEPSQPCEEPGLLDRESQRSFSQRRQQNALRHALQQAVQTEDYEQAARLRDQLRSLEQQ